MCDARHVYVCVMHDVCVCVMDMHACLCVFVWMVCWTESEWSAEEEAQEQKMMEDLVAVIEQRNAIISSLDEERQR